MFGDRKHSPQKRIDCLIGAGTTVRGGVVFAGGLRIDGHVSGNVSTADGQVGTLVVSEHARVEGSIRVSHIVINGTVEGPVTASDHLELQSKARVTGDVAYKTLEMHVGAMIQGRLDHGHAEPESAAVVELKRVGA